MANQILICCNEAVVVLVKDCEEKQARDLLEGLAKQHYVDEHTKLPYEEYRAMFYWHIHKVGTD